MSELARGAHDVRVGFRYLNAHPRLWGYVVAPAIVTLAVMVAAVLGIAHLVGPLVDRVTDVLPDVLASAAGALLWIIVVVALGFGALLVFVSIAGMIAGPFNELLSEAIEAEVTQTPGPRFSLARFAREAAVGVAHGLRRLVLALACFALLLVLGFVPIIGTAAAAVLGFWLAARSAAYDCYDAVLARRALAYRDKLAYLAEHRSRTFGLGATVAALLLVPGVNLVALGLGAAGATLATAAPPTARPRP